MPEDENLRLAYQYMGQYLDDVVERHKAARENPYLLDQMDQLIDAMREMKDELAEVRAQNERLLALLDGAEELDRAEEPDGVTTALDGGGAGPPTEATPPATLKERISRILSREPKAEEAQPKKKLTPLGILSNVVFYLCMVLLLVGALTFAQSDDTEKSLFGFRYYYIKTASMVPVYPVGSIVITKVTDPADIQVGDDITVYVGDGQSDTYLTHRVVELTTDSTGELAFRTKGVNNKSNDPEPFSAKLMVGKVVFCIPVLGTVMTFVRSQLWLVIGIFILLLALSFMLRLLFSKEEPEEPPAVEAADGVRPRRHKRRAPRPPAEPEDEPPPEAEADKPPLEEAPSESPPAPEAEREEAALFH